MPQSLAAILFFHGECVNLKISQLQLQLFFSIWVFFHEHSQFTGQQEKGKVICLTDLYHFQLLCRPLNISRETKAEISLLHIASSRTRTRNFDCCTPSQLQLFIKYRLLRNSNIADIFTWKRGFRNNFFFCLFGGSVALIFVKMIYLKL